MLYIIWFQRRKTKTRKTKLNSTGYIMQRMIYQSFQLHCQIIPQYYQFISHICCYMLYLIFMKEYFKYHYSNKEVIFWRTLQYSICFLFYRLWGDHGQEALESAHVCLINATATGTEILKNLVLPGNVILVIAF